MGYHAHSDCVAVTKHYILSFMFLGKFIFFLMLSCLFYFIGIDFLETFGIEFTKFIIFPLTFIFFNYSFFKLILGFIEYYNYLFIIKDDQIFIINCSFLLKDDIEIIDSIKVIKVDSYSRGLFSNLLGYGTIVIELQSREVRSFRFMPNPFKLVRKLQEQRDTILKNRSTKFVAVKEEEVFPLQ